MYYCVRCGDPISQGEMICDKCGYRFTFVEGTNIPTQAATGSGQPSAQGKPVTNATVYMQPVVRTTAAQSRPGAVPPPVSKAGNANTAALPPAGNAVKAPAKKKKSKKWMIPFFIILGTLTTAAIVFLVIGALLIGGVIMLFSDDDLYVENATQGTAYQADSGTVSYDNEQFVVDNEYVDSAIRDPFVTLKGDGTDTATVMVYLNGSSLETENGCATADLKEMLSASLSDNVNVVIQTGGTKKWHSSNISSKRSQRYVVSNNQLVLIDDSLDQLDITDENTLAGFIAFCRDNYPADRNILILWDHGAGPVYGFGENEVGHDYEAALTLDEIQRAVASSGVKFEMIGFDACLMGTIETACALYDYSDYLIASEDFEPGEGWQYQNWLSLLGYNSSTPMKDIAKVIIDDYVAEARVNDSDAILSLVDLRYTRLLFSSWVNFAYASESDLLASNYNMEMHRSDRAGGPMKTGFWDLLFGESTMEEYCYCVDLMALASTLDTEEAKALSSALSYALVYSAATASDANMTGLSVTLPYNDTEFYSELEKIFLNCGLDSNYVTFLKKFATSGSSQSYNWSDSDWGGWRDPGNYYDNQDYDWSYYDWNDYTDEDYGWDSYDYDDDWYSPWYW